jgi:hypothetical protein
MAEINAGRPVLIQLNGHTMTGVGYDVTGQTVYVHDTWDNSVHSMTWGGSYSGMNHIAVTVIHLAPPSQEGMHTVVLNSGEVVSNIDFGNHGELSDFNGDGIVNFKDFAILAYYWADFLCTGPGWCEGCDYDQSGAVDLEDMKGFAVNWLWQYN